MTNKEIRTLAKEKRGTTRGLVPVSLTVFGLLIALEVVLTIGIQRAPGSSMAVPNVVVAVLSGLICGAGLSSASIAAWKTGVTRPAELFSGFKSGRLFMRALAPVLVAVALSLAWSLFITTFYLPQLLSLMDIARDPAQNFRQVMMDGSPTMYAMPFAGLAFGFCSLIVGQLYFTIHLWPETPITTVLWRGCKRAVRAFWRVFGMGFMTVIKFALIFYGLMIGGLLLGMLVKGYAVIIIMIVLVLGALVYLFARLMPYLLLAFAGLAIDIFGEDGPKMEETK